MLKFFVVLFFPCIGISIQVSRRASPLARPRRVFSLILASDHPLGQFFSFFFPSSRRQQKNFHFSTCQHKDPFADTDSCQDTIGRSFDSLYPLWMDDLTCRVMSYETYIYGDFVPARFRTCMKEHKTRTREKEEKRNSTDLLAAVRVVVSFYLCVRITWGRERCE